jgi:hypothetical protein
MELGEGQILSGEKEHLFAPWRYFEPAKYSEAKLKPAVTDFWRILRISLRYQTSFSCRPPWTGKRVGLPF